jgi:hypothetical protein
MLHTWFVTFEVPKTWTIARKRRATPRETRTFASEAEARDFARSKFQDGLMVFAGTINPHLPKLLISTRCISNWLDGMPAENLSRSAEGSEPQDV